MKIKTNCECPKCRNLEMPLIRLILSNYIFLSLTASFVFAINFYLDLKTELQFYLFQRSGSLVVILGALISIRKFIFYGIKETIESSGVISGGNAYHPNKEDMKNHKKDTISTYIGSVWLFIGTVIWGYGDLIIKGITDVTTQ